MNIHEEIRNAINLRDDIGKVENDLYRYTADLRTAQEAARETAEGLKAAEDQVIAVATITKDERLPSAVSSPGYKPALNTILQESHNDELIGEVQDRDNARRELETAQQFFDTTHNRMKALKMQADLQAVILTAMTMAADQPAVRTVPTPVGAEAPF